MKQQNIRANWASAADLLSQISKIWLTSSWVMISISQIVEPKFVWSKSILFSVARKQHNHRLYSVVKGKFELWDKFFSATFCPTDRFTSHQENHGKNATQAFLAFIMIAMLFLCLSVKIYFKWNGFLFAFGRSNNNYFRFIINWAETIQSLRERNHHCVSNCMRIRFIFIRVKTERMAQGTLFPASQ